MSKSTEDKDRIQAKWRGLAGFFAWKKYFQPVVLGPNKKYEIWKPTAAQIRYIVNAFQGDVQICLSVQPRRHGKSTVHQMLVLYFVCAYQNFTVQLLGCTEDHGKRTMLQPLKNIIRKTPKLSKLIPEATQWNNLIYIAAFENRIQLATGSLGLGAFGDKTDILWVSDFHNFNDLTAYEAFQGGLLDQEETKVLIDSNVDESGGPVHLLEQSASNDKTIYCQAVSYRDMEDYIKNAPAWINRKTAIRMAKTNPLAVKRDLLGQRSSGVNRLFSNDAIESACQDYHVPVQDIQDIIKGRKYKIGGGLDRAKKIIPGLTGDSTVWTVVLKVARPADEAEYYVLQQTVLKLNTDKALKKMILDSHKRYGLDSCFLEDFHISGEIQEFLTKSGIAYKVVAPTSQTQNLIFPEFHRLMQERRFYFSKDLKTFKQELSHFRIKELKNGNYSFGHGARSGHDDTVFSTAWALYGLSRFQLDLYSLDILQCNTHKIHRGQCILLGGDHIVSCSNRCGSYHQVQDMFQDYVRLSLDGEIEVGQFFKEFVRVGTSVVS